MASSAEERCRAMEMEIEALRQQVVSLGGTPAARGGGQGAALRKKGVAICSEQIDDESFLPPVFPKSDGSRVLIEGAMAGSAIFNNLSAEQCEC